MADCSFSLLAENSLEQWTSGHGHVHFGVPFHAALDALVGLLPWLIYHAAGQKRAEEDHKNHDHHWGAEKFGCGELPAYQHDHDDPQFGHQIRRGKFKDERSCEIRSLAKDGSRKRDRSVGT